jgi:hypothetical protein
MAGSRRVGSRVALVFAAVGLAASVWGCSGHGGSSTPTSPSDPTALTGASVSGNVTTAGHAASGIRVTVDGSAASSTTDATGRFALDGVSPGDRVVMFTTANAQAPVSLQSVQPGEHVEMDVDVEGSRATVTSTNRHNTTQSGVLALQISPDSWNTNWTRSAGTVTVFFRGTGFDAIDPASVVLEGDDPAKTPLAPRSSRIEGDHLRATFGKADAFALLLAPVVPGQTRTVVVGYVENGSTGELDGTVHIVGPAH